MKQIMKFIEKKNEFSAFVVDPYENKLPREYTFDEAIQASSE